jgi:hypothetical protein
MKEMSHVMDGAYWPVCLDLSTNKMHRWFLSFALAPLFYIEIFEIEKKVFSWECKHPLDYSKVTIKVGGFFPATSTVQVEYDRRIIS